MKLGLLMLCYLLAPYCSAQYVVAKKGDAVPFEQAVITNAPTFKLESEKLGKQAALIKSLNAEVAGLRREMDVLEKQLKTEQEAGKVSNEQYLLTLEAYNTVHKQYNEALKKLKRQNRFYNRKEFWAGVGIAVGILLAK